MRFLVLLPLLLSSGCDKPADPNPIEPNRTIRQPIEGPEPPAEPTRFGYDEHGHLLPAKSLVHGFEVPMGLSAPETRHDYLEFTITAPMVRLKEFYQGLEEATDQRFSRRDYRIDEGRNGFEVWHTDRTLARLGLDDRYRRAHLFITPHHNRTQLLRVHVPRDEARRVFLPDLAEPERPRANRYLDEPTRNGPSNYSGAAENPSKKGTSGDPEGAEDAAPGATGDSTTKEASNYSGEEASNYSGAKENAVGSGSSGHAGVRGKSTAGGGGGEGDPEPMRGEGGGEPSGIPLPPGAVPGDLDRPQQGGAGGRLITSEQVPAATEKAKQRYGPYPDHLKRDIRPLIREWQKRNPGKTFLD